MEILQGYGIFRNRLAKINGLWYDKYGDFMLEYIENLKLVSVIKGVTCPNTVHTSYPHRLILRLTGTIRYNVEGNTLVLSPGDVLFLTNSPTYFGEQMTAETGTYILVNFEGNLPDTPPRPYALYKQIELQHLFTQLYLSWSLRTPASHCRCMSLLYELLSHFAEISKNDIATPTVSIEPALKFLEKNIFDPDLKIGKLHELCRISDTYFRQLFITRFGVSPKQYVTKRRLSQAKAILDSGEYDSISEVALMTGFEDALYFSKAFRNKYGYPPSAL